MKYLIIGVLCFIIAIGFGYQNTVEISIAFGNALSSEGIGQNTTAAGASAGFAIAGGLCLIASSLDKKNNT